MRGQPAKILGSGEVRRVHCCPTTTVSRPQPVMVMLSSKPVSGPVRSPTDLPMVTDACGKVGPCSNYRPAAKNGRR